MENQTSTPKPAKITMTTAAAPQKNDTAFAVKNGNEHVMQSFNDTTNSPSTVKVLFILLLMAAFGVGTGYVFATQKVASKQITSAPADKGSIQKGQTFGTNDTSSYKDTAEGLVKEGGIEGEGQFHLERPGGESQNVYMTSSTVDLAPFVGKKVKVWGATQAAQKAGWLMDVGKVEVL